MREWQVGDSFPVDEPAPSRRVIALPPPPSKSRLRVFASDWVWPLFFTYLAFSVSWLIATPISLYYAIAALRRSRRAALIMLLLGPLVLASLFGFARGLIEYGQGRASLCFSRSENGFLILDPETRCYRRAAWHGPVDEPFSALANDGAIRLATRLCGPMRGHHQGWYPNRVEAFAALREPDARTARWSAYEDIDGALLAELIRRELPRALKLSVPADHRLRSAFRYWRAQVENSERNEVRFVERTGTLLIGDDNLVLLISGETGALYACYTRDEF